MAASPKIMCGLEMNAVPDLAGSLHEAIATGFDFVSVPLFVPHNGPPDVPEALLAHSSDLVLDSARWSTCIVGRVAPWPEPGDAAARRGAEQALRAELSWAAHLAVPAVMVQAPHTLSQCAPFSAQLLQAVQSHSSLFLWVRVPLESAAVAPSSGAASLPSAPKPQPDFDSPWRIWNAMRTFSDYSHQLCVALELSADLPPEPVLRRWLAEPVRAAVLPTSAFIPNHAGYPVLPRKLQEFVLQLLQRSVQFLLAGPPAAVPQQGTGAADEAADEELVGYSASSPAAGVAPGAPSGPSAYTPYLKYLTHLSSRWDGPSPIEAFEAPFVDVLQAPLQPLSDNLESATYEVFERDPVKYQGYEDAVVEALRAHTAAPPPPAVGNGIVGAAQPAPVVVMVVGAGRGPLVRRVLAASLRTGVPVRVYAVEKNPNAVITLRHLVASEGWAGTVTVVAGDMRAWAAPEPADILVSELLGSFGDNELSPECLDGVQRFLRRDVAAAAHGSASSGAAAPDPAIHTCPACHSILSSSHPSSASGGVISAAQLCSGPEALPVPRWWRGPGVSIPAAYTSFLAPVHTPRLWQAARSVDKYEAVKWMETAYVVRMASFLPLGPAQPVFTFHHPNREAPIDNSREARLSWVAQSAGVCHGFAGYFDAQLFAGVHISINPDTHSPGMFSWFPLFFPLREAVEVQAGDTIELHMTRNASDSRVWYEWALTAPRALPIHNPGGRSYSMRL